MGFSKINAMSLTDLFVQQIENMILSGELDVGEQLPPARELSLRMGVSRPVISAGVIELEKLGFVEVRPRQGVYVCDYRRRGTLETLVAIMRYNGGTMRSNEVRSLLETRGALECLCVQLVVERASDAELATLAPLLEAIRTARDNDGAAEAVFVDKRADAVKLVRDNLELCGLLDRARVRSGDSLAYLRSGEKFDLIFLGYKSFNLIEQILVGSTADKVIRYATCSVLIYRPDRAEHIDI